MGFLTRLLAGLVAASTLGAGLTGTAGAPATTSGDAEGVVTATADDTTNLPDHIINGDFEYDDGAIGLSDTSDNWTYITRQDGMYWHSGNWEYGTPEWRSLTGFDKSRFGWDSTQTGSGIGDQKTNAVELQQDRSGNKYAELAAAQADTAIYQDLKTTPGTLYKIRLKHASYAKGHVDTMQVMVGAPGSEQPVEMTRTSVNSNGDRLNEKSTTIATKVSNAHGRDHEGQWETYEGTYVIPEGQTVTRFTFKSLDSYNNPTYNNYYGNELDDIVFAKAYKLTYDKNAQDATGQVPSNQRGGENTTQPAKVSVDGGNETSEDTADNPDDDSTDTDSTTDDGAQSDAGQQAEIQSLTSQDRATAKSSLPDHIVNGSFDYPACPDGKDSCDVDPTTGWGGFYVDYGRRFMPIPNWDRSKFGWDSSQEGLRPDQQPTSHQKLQHCVQIGNKANNNGKKMNRYAEIIAETPDEYLYQDIATTPGVMYKWSLKHASEDTSHVDSMQVMIGSPGKETAQQATRTTSNGRGDKTGVTSKTIATKGAQAEWETYTGVYVATSTVTRFTFKSAKGRDSTRGNFIDDVQFKLAYKLSYDKNSQDAYGQVPSDETANTVKQAKAKTTGSVRLAAEKTASGLTVHDLETDDVPGDYRQFVLNTTDTRFSQVEFEDGAWYKSTDSSSQGMWPLRIGASLTIPSVGEWTDPTGRTHQISMTMRLKDWNGGSVSELYRFDGHGNIVGDGRFWINTAYGSGYSSLPKQVEQAMGKVDTSKRVGCSWTVEFTYTDTGEKVPDTFRGVTGFNDLDGWDAQPDLKFEGVQLLSGFDGAYKRSDAELRTYGTNGFAGVKHDAGDEAHLDAPQQSRHRLAATWTGSTFTFSYDLSNPAGRTDGSRMTFGSPVTRTAVLTYDKNASDATGSVPSNTTPGTTQTVSSDTDGTVKDLVQRTTTHADGSVTVRTVDATTDVVSGCQVYYPAGQKITLATMAKDDDCWDSSMLSRPGHTQLGWNQDRNATQAQAQVTMVEGGMTVYAVWVGNPVLTYDTNKPATWSGQMPSTPASISVAYNTAATDGSGWRAGDVSKIRGYKFLGWYTGPQDNAGLYDWNTLLTGNVTVYAHWQRLQANVIYDKNASDAKGSHANTTGWQYSDVTIPGDTSKSFTRDGYVFKGWSLKAGKADVVYKDGSQIPLQDKDITLYAQWQGIHENFTETGGISLPLLIAGGIGLLVMGVGSTVMLTRRMNGHGMPDGE